MDCLPSPTEWSPPSQYAMMLEHVQALRHHLEALESAASQGAVALIAAEPHLVEINARSLDAHELMRLLAALPESEQAALGGEAC